MPDICGKQTPVNMKRKLTPEIITFLKGFEELRLPAYLCPAAKALPKAKQFYTIGYGCTFYENGAPVKKGDKITKERAESLFMHVLTGFAEKADKAIKSDVNDNQFSAFVSALFNCGPGKAGVKSGLIELKTGGPSTLLRRINANPNDPTIEAAFLQWVSAGSSFENGLRRRRSEEAKIYFS